MGGLAVWNGNVSVVTLAGGGGFGGTTGGYADGAGTAALFNYPIGIAMNGAGAFAVVVRMCGRMGWGGGGSIVHR